MTDETRPQLSATEHEVLRLVATGATNREIARERGITEATVKKHLTNIYNKLGAGNRTEAVRVALEEGLVTVDTPETTQQRESDEMGREAAAHLAQELERTRRRSRHLLRGVAVAALIVVVLSAAAIYAYFERRPDTTSDATPTAQLPERTWLPGVNLPTARSGLALVSSPSDGTVFAIGGRGASRLLDETLALPIKGLRWVPREPKPTAVEYASAVALRGEILVPGGCTRSGAATDAVEIYSPQTDTWRRANPLPRAVCGYALAELEGEVYLFGGRSSADATDALDHVWQYDPAGDEWSERDRMPLARSDMATVVVGGSIRLLGGRDRSGKPQSGHWIYMPWKSSWDLDSAPPLPEGRAGLSAAASGVKNVYVVGGGWDRKLDDGVLLLRLASPDPDWEPQPDVPGFTPQRGAGMTLVEERLLVLAGGEADGKPLDRQYRWEVVPIRFIFPGAAGLR